MSKLENMKESIIIKNFGPIREISIQEIKPFTVLIGESGSGKSALMKALALFRWIYKMQNIRSYLKYSNIEKSPFYHNMTAYIKNSGFEQFINDKTEILYSCHAVSCGTRNSETHEIEYKNKRLKVSGTIREDLLEFIKIGFISESRNIIPQWLDTSQDADLGFYFKELTNDFKLANNAIDELPVDFLGIKFKRKKERSGMKYIIESIKGREPETYKILYKHSSSGMQNVIPLLLITEYFTKHFSFKEAFERSVLKYLLEGDRLTDFKAIKNLAELPKKIYLHIEEPELSLYPETQRSLIDTIVNKCFSSENKNNENKKIELMIATHSPYIINHLNLLTRRFDVQEKPVNYNYDKSAKYNYDDLAVYHIEDGTITDLKIKNKRLIDTNQLSEPIDAIYNEYQNLG